MIAPIMEHHVALTPDEVFGLLADRRRRYALHYLRSAGSDVVQLDPLIDWVTKQLDEEGVPDDDRRERLETSLHHVHLPHLAASGVLDYDWRSRTIRYRTCDTLESHLELAEGSDLS